MTAVPRFLRQLLLVIILAGCSFQNTQLSPPEANPTAAATPQPAEQPPAGLTAPGTTATEATVSASATLPPTTTPTATPTATPTLTAAPTTTPTVPPTPGTVRLAVIGDYGQVGQSTADVAGLVKSWQPDFIITTGDNNYPNGSAETIDANIGQYYHEFMAPYRGEYGPGAAINRFFPSLGNHDWQTTGAAPYLDYFTLPGNERYYDFTWGPVHLFAINSDSREPDGIHQNSIQASWLQERLAASTAPWKLVYMHVPPYSSGHHGSAPVMRWPYAEWGTTAVLAGHDHVYERLEVEGIPYFVNGLGGNGRYRFLNILPQSQVRFNSDFGAMLIEATERWITFQFITRQGELIDSYAIIAE